MTNLRKVLVWAGVALIAAIGVFFNLKVLVFVDIALVAFFLYWFNRKK